MLSSTLWTWLLCIWTVSEIVIAVATRTRRGQGKLQDQGSQVILWIVIVAGINGCELTRHLVHSAIFGPSSVTAPLSLAILITGLAIRSAAIWTLGRSFSANVAIRDAQRVKRTGLYAVVRHPSYSGLLLVLLAIGVHSGNWLSLTIVFVPTTIALLHRIRIEEAALHRAFGQEYAEYAKVTRRLVPGVY